MLKRIPVTLLFLLCLYGSHAQTADKCGYFQLQKALATRPYTVENIGSYSKATIADDTTTNVIPVVFHIILNATQIQTLGGEDRIPSYIENQLIALNRDFNAKNNDSVMIPAAFKSLYANARVRFALAHTTAGGNSTPGFDVRIINSAGFDFETGYASGIGYSKSKYSDAGGLNAWDPTTYLNIWVINPLDDGKSTTLLGLTFPPSLINKYSLPLVERGITLNYRIWRGLGEQRLRTLTHEMGHYFELRHIWGDDNGACPNDGGTDDGIADTPPQTRETYGCPHFPKYDACSPTGAGIMFMNYMDYTDDPCQQMFTTEQVALMRRQLLVFGNSNSLIRHPQVLSYPSGTVVNYRVFPNPTSSFVNINFTQTSADLQFINMYNSMGERVYTMPVTLQQGFYTIDVSRFAKGIYMLQLNFNDKQQVHRIAIN